MSLLLSLTIIPAQGKDAETSDHNLFLPFIAQHYETTWHWGDISLISLYPSPQSSPISIIDVSGRLHIFWDTSPLTGAAFIYHIYQTEDGWSEPGRIADTLGISGLLTAPILGQDGRIHLLWRNSLSFSGPDRIMYAAFNGISWEAEKEITRWENLAEFNARINVDFEGNPHITYTIKEYFISTRREYVTLISGIWQEPQNINPDFLSSVTWSILPDSSGGVHFYGTAGLDPTRLYYAFWEDGEFLIKGQPFSGIVKNRNSLLDSHNIVHLYWAGGVPIPGGSVTGVYHQCLYPDLSWGEEKLVSGQQAASGYQAAWDGGDQMVFAWKASEQTVSLVFVDVCTVNNIYTTEFEPITYGWGSLTSVSLNTSVSKACVVVKRNYVQEYGVRCAEFRR